MMMFEDRQSLAAIRTHKIKMVGTGNGTVPTVVYGHGITLAWVATGRVVITWAENPGTFIGIAGFAFQDTTQSNVKGMTVTNGTYPNTASTFTLEIDIWGSDTAAAADLATTSYLNLNLDFSELKTP